MITSRAAGMTVAAAERQVAEVLIAWRVCCPEGEELSGQHLKRWWDLPEPVQRYFTALLAPQIDPGLP